MTPDDRRRLDRLVLEAAALSPTELPDLLAAVAAEDATLAEEVRRRLDAAADLPEAFLLPLSPTLLDDALADSEVDCAEPPAGDERWEIGECLGVGGMSRVYRAFDRRLGRPVALKLLRTSDPETPRRVLSEARAQARVRHDHVIEVYETGELDGRPYIAMRHVAGGTLAELDRSVGIEARVRLAAQVAEGLHAAHREGLLHGDVKPSNVLVEPTPEGELRAWIGDFGIATEMAAPATAGRAGTPAFLAPEIRHRRPDDTRPIDRRADVYGLGATLWQLLAGEPPGSDASPARLRERAPGLPADLAAIVARCLDPEPEGRYPSARAVAEDLYRFLDGEVVEAYADRLAYRLTRFAVRHRTLLALAAVSTLLLAAALVTAAAMGVRAIRANALADQRRVQAEELISFTLLDLRDRLDAVGRLDLLDTVGERAMRYFAAVPAAELSDEELARRSTALYQIGDVRLRRGDLAGALQPFEESLELARRLAARAPRDPERLYDLGQSEFWVGYARWRQGELAAARRHFEAYHRISEELVERAPDDPDVLRELSYANSNLGSVLQEEEKHGEALEAFRAALAIDRRLVAERPEHPDAPAWRFELAATHNTIGVVLERMGRLDEAEEHYRADLSLRRELVADQPENQRFREFLGTAHQYLGSLLLLRGRTAAAGEQLASAHDLFAELTERDPGNGDWRYKLAWSHLRLGQLAEAEGRTGAAREPWEAVHRIAGELAADGGERVDWRLLRGVSGYLRARVLAGERPDEARAELRRALPLLEPLVEARPAGRRARRWLAEALLLAGDLEPEADAMTRAWSRAAELLAPAVRAGSRDPWEVATWRRAMERLGRTDEAEAAAARLREMGVPSS